MHLYLAQDKLIVHKQQVVRKEMAAGNFFLSCPECIWQIFEFQMYCKALKELIIVPW